MGQFYTYKVGTQQRSLSYTELLSMVDFRQHKRKWARFDILNSNIRLKTIKFSTSWTYLTLYQLHFTIFNEYHEPLWEHTMMVYVNTRTGKTFKKFDNTWDF